jgi:hypothetical protein
MLASSTQLAAELFVTVAAAAGRTVASPTRESAHTNGTIQRRRINRGV